jgi:CubicO group peptidase (beta-lactamase class C family)
MPTPLPRSAPADQGVDPAAVLSFLDALDEQPDIEMHSLMVVRHGQVVTEGWWAPYTADRPQLLYSLSKSFTSTAAAFAQAEGLLDLDDTVISHFPEFAADITDPRSRSMKVRHVASMASGHTRETLGDAVRLDPREPVRGFLLTPPDRDPGTVFAYNQPCTYTLGSIVQRNAGLPLTQYLRPRLFDPLGIGHVGWHTFPPGGPPGGREEGFTGLHARTEDIAKLGLLYLQQGQWEGSQLISKEWVAEATSVQVSNSGNGSPPDWQQGYGFQFWTSRHGYRGDGAFGQFCVVLPDQDAVIVTTAYTFDMQAMLDAMWAHLLPGMGAVSPDAGAPDVGSAQDKLSARLAALSLPALAGAPTPAPGGWGPWTSGPFAVAAPGMGDAELPLFVPSTDTFVTSIEVADSPAGGWQISLIEPGNALTVPVGTGAWTVSDLADRLGNTIPVAASGGWADDQTLRAEVIFLETPHRMDITCALAGRSAEAVWGLPPIRPSKLEDMRCPS